MNNGFRHEKGTDCDRLRLYDQPSTSDRIGAWISILALDCLSALLSLERPS